MTTVMEMPEEERHQLLTNSFKRQHLGGPNLYYMCRHCSTSWPGVEIELALHLDRHPECKAQAGSV